MRKNSWMGKGLILCLLLMIVLVFATSCGQDPSNPSDTMSTDTVESDELEQTAETYSYDLRSFTVVRPKGYSEYMDDAISAVCEMLMEMGIAEPMVTDDEATAADPTAKEILIGETNREESASAKSLLTKDNQYALVFRENKIVIQVAHEGILEGAVRSFKEEYLSLARNCVLTVEKEYQLIGASASSAVRLADNGKAIYNVVLSGTATQEEKDVASLIVSRISAFAGDMPEIIYDDLTPYKKDAYNIVVGDTSYPETAEAKASMARDQYGIKVIGNKLVVVSPAGALISKAGDLLAGKIADEGNRNAQSVMLRPDDSWIEEEKNYFFDFPEFTEGTLKVELDNENKNLMYSYTGVKSEDFSAYCQEMEAYGYTLWQSNQIGGNHFRTYRNAKGEVCLSFYSDLSKGTLHIFTDRHTETAPIPDADLNYEKVTEATLHVMSLDYSHRTVYDGHGMNYVITLEDGRYIVMDGGYSSGAGSRDDERIYNYLVEHNKRPDGKVVIAAWFMSHPHDDHFGAFDSFVPKYKDMVTIEYFIANPYSPSMASGRHWMLNKLPALLAQTNTALIKPHTGQIIQFCNTQLEVVYTHENLYPNRLNDTNNSSTVIRLRQNGHTALFTGDAAVDACNMMVKLYGDHLKSDIFQVNHHGYSGGTWEFYNAATREDSYVLWTCSKEAFADRTYGALRETSIVYEGILKPNRDLALKVGFDRCYYADGIVEQITFPEGGEIQISEERDVSVDPRG